MKDERRKRINNYGAGIYVRKSEAAQPTRVWS
jgi:hypothetical protein